MKLVVVVVERETGALERWLKRVEGELVAADLVRIELQGAVHRVAPDRAGRSREVLDDLFLLSVTCATFEQAARLDPPELRSSDAVHLATALELGDDLGGMVVYDDRLAAAGYGIPIVTPGRQSQGG